MGARSVAALLVGVTGAVWAVTALADWGRRVQHPEYLAGFALLLVALAVWGSSLVPGAPTWMRFMVTVSTAVFGYSLWLATWDTVHAHHLLLLVTGLVFVLGAAVVAVRRHPHPPRRVE